MKHGRHKSTIGKRANNAVTPLAYNDSPTSPNQGVNVDYSVRDDSPHHMVGDVILLAFTSTYVANMTSSPKKMPRVKMMANKKCLSRGPTNTSQHLLTIWD